MRSHSTADPKQPGVIQVTGSSDSGKTTLIERLIPRLRKHGLRVGTVKHAHHGFEMDQRGKDSWRHAQAGAGAVAIIAPTRAAWLIETPSELSCSDAVKRMAECVDLVLVEGFKLAGRDGGCAAHLKISLEPGAGFRMAVESARCRIGVPVEQLRPEELERIVRCCLRAPIRMTTGALFKVRGSRLQAGAVPLTRHP